MQCEYCKVYFDGIMAHQRQCKKKKAFDAEALVVATTKKVEEELERDFDCKIESINRGHDSELNCLRQHINFLQHELEKRDQFIKELTKERKIEFKNCEFHIHPSTTALLDCWKRFQCAYHNENPMIVEGDVQNAFVATILKTKDLTMEKKRENLEILYKDAEFKSPLLDQVNEGLVINIY